ncbi:hypothetical protein ABKV33_03665 [Enterobacter ludwigii]|uniref:hypothetical protein n=1 Tax=Enterobacter ludwigii TaxID=299767 RepID=UPI0024315C8B|nr:hypothetical protein [Enterobacter ludwigii]WFY38762.1 hypothetical protein NFK33_13020 [Enterobacter ludwigii]
MKFFGFIIFSLVALAYIWNGKDNFNKKEWVVFFVKLSFILVGTFILVFVLIGLREIFPSMTKEDGELVLIVIPPSFVTLLLAKFFVVMLCSIFETIMRFHQRYNTVKIIRFCHRWQTDIAPDCYCWRNAWHHLVAFLYSMVSG